MTMCPKCNRNSLEYSEARKTAWCLYVTDCGFSEQVEGYNAYIEKYECVMTYKAPQKEKV